MAAAQLLPELTPQCLSHIFSQLPSSDAARAACVQRLWRELVQHDEHLWKRFVADDLGLSDKRGADGTQKSTFREAYASWRLEYGAEYWPYLPRAIKAWEQTMGWLATNYPAIRATIKAGASEAEIAGAEEALGFQLPPAVKVIYRLHNGQALALDDALDRHEAARTAATARFQAALTRLTQLRQDLDAARADGNAAAVAATAAAVEAASAEVAAAKAAEAAAAGPTGPESQAELDSIFHGMFGGYSVYDHMVCGRMMPLQRAVAWTKTMELHRIRPRAAAAATAAAGGAAPPPPQLMAVACSFRVYDKLFVADMADGAIWVVRRGPRGTLMEPAAPRGSGPDGAVHRDGFLRWFEEYGRRLAAGYYEVAPLDEELVEGSRAISLFPLAAPAMTEAVTRGVRVRASVVYVPEQLPGGNRHLFAYSIRMSLLEPADAAAAAQGGGSAAAAAAAPLLAAPPLLRCQLVSRHWVIRNEHGAQVDEVRGEGVIGKYPVLEPGGEDFVYCSCTHQQATRGSMEGDFRFVEGTMERPTGPSFDVVCPLFRLDVPEFIY